MEEVVATCVALALTTFLIAKCVDNICDGAVTMIENNKNILNALELDTDSF